MKIFSTILFLFLCFGVAGQKQLIDSLARELPKLSGKERFTVLSDLSYYTLNTDIEKSLYYANECLEFAKKQKDDYYTSEAYNALASAYLRQGNSEKSIDYNLKALSIREMRKDTAGIISSRSKLGVIYYDLGKIEEATRENSIAIDLARKIGNKPYEMSIASNMALSLQFAKRYKEAEKLYLEILEFSKGLNDEMSLTNVYGNLGAVNLSMKNFPRARSYYNKAMEIAKRNEFDEQLAGVYQGLGVVERESGNFQKGLEYYLKTYELEKKIGSVLSQASITVNIGATYMDMEKFDQAEEYFLKGIELSKYTRSYARLKYAYESLSKLEEKRKDYLKALEYQKIASLYKDSIAMTAGSDDLADMYVKYETEKKEKALTEERLENTLKDQALVKSALVQEKVTRSRQIWIFVAVIILILALISAYILHTKRKRAEEKVLLTRKEEELKRERELNQQKIEISRELHDNIGSQITYMISSLDNAQYLSGEESPLTSKLNQIANFGRDTMNELRSTVWAMNMENGSLQNLVLRLKTLQENIAIPLEIRNETKAEHFLNGFQLLHCFRIIQEFIQNSIKYSECTKVSISFSEQNGKICLKLSDDGKGFSLAESIGGNGIINMNHRCESIGGKSEWESDSNGTAFSCSWQYT